MIERGNDSTDRPSYPAAYPDCINAASVHERNRLTKFSDWVTTAAPGLDLPVAAGEAEYKSWSRTSFSCAIVAGTVALMLRVNPSPLDRIKRILKSVGPRTSHADDAPNAGCLRCGTGS
jgi:subtilisin family serine protease